MAHITVREAQAWVEKTKLDLGSNLDGELEVDVSAQVLARVAQVYDTSSWVDFEVTPRLIRSIISMTYTAYIYARTYSDDTDGDTYSVLLLARADALLQNIIDGITVIPEVPPIGDTSEPAFYPTDASTASSPTDEDPSLGPNQFSMGTVF